MRLTAPAEGLYRGVNALRRSLYSRGVLRSRRAERPVLSIGNIVIGGAGKTPTTIAICRALVGRGVNVCVLSRGHGRRDVNEIALVDGLDATRFGDEPVLLSAELPAVKVVVGRDRFAAAEWFLQRHSCDLFVLDDGFQHLQLARDCDVVVDVPGRRLSREARAVLSTVDAIVARDGAAGHDGVPTFAARLEPSDVRRGTQRIPLEEVRGSRYVAFAGLADNQQFFAMLRSLGADVAHSRAFRDHHAYTPEELQQLQRLARENEARLITTPKDAVKCDSVETDVLETSMQIERLDDLVRLILRQCRLLT